MARQGLERRPGLLLWGSTRTAHDSGRLIRVPIASVPWRAVGLWLSWLSLTAVVGALLVVATNWSTIASYGLGATREAALTSPRPRADGGVGAGPTTTTIADTRSVAGATPRAVTAAPQAPPRVAPDSSARGAQAPISLRRSDALTAQRIPPSTLPAATAPVVLRRSDPLTADAIEPLSATQARAAAGSTAGPPSVDEAWTALLPQLGVVWDVDTAASIGLLDDFLATFPEYAPAQDKLYAALLARAREHLEAAEWTAAANDAERAAALLPERSEADAVLLEFAPTPTPPVAAPVMTAAAAPARAPGRAVVEPPPPAPRPQAPARSVPPAAPAPVRSAPAAVPAPVAAPTKVPFVPPRGP